MATTYFSCCKVIPHKVSIIDKIDAKIEKIIHVSIANFVILHQKQKKEYNMDQEKNRKKNFHRHLTSKAINCILRKTIIMVDFDIIDINEAIDGLSYEEQLNYLKEKGILNDEEFAAQKAKLLGSK